MGRSEGNSKAVWPPFLIKRLSEGSFILVLTLALFVFFSLLTYDSTDPAWSHLRYTMHPIVNAGGWVGAHLADGLYVVFGFAAFALPLGFAYLSGVILYDHRALRVVNKHMLALRAVGFLLSLAGTCGLLSLLCSMPQQFILYGPGGFFGRSLSMAWVSILNLQGALLLLLGLFLVGITWLTGLSWVKMTEWIGRYCIYAVHQCVIFSRKMGQYIHVKLQQAQTLKRERVDLARSKIPVLIPSERSTPVVFVKKEKKQEMVVMPVVDKPISRPTKSIPSVVVSGELPALSLLNKGVPGKPLGGHTHEALEHFSREVEQHLMDFGIQADVVAVHPGPVITRFELQLAAGVKVSKLSALSKDLARSLSVTSVRVVEIIPGKTVVGIELPNEHRATVAFSDVLSADVFQQAHSPLTLALGVDIAGHPMVVDLGKMPHLLVAGTTGSGKSVGINAMILSILFKSSPEEVRLIMVDPKMLELSVYDGIPHLLTPVVTDMKEAASALRWCVGEMERRYRLMASFGVRNLAGFNAKVIEASAHGEKLVDPLWKSTDSMDLEAPALETLPYIVVVIDELADMMMVVGKKVEQLIARIAQKARAAGIHLILATQRPSVDVLTGLIKSNIPTRISFQVSSKIDSRTILDQQGAEQLLGAGDMLFLAPGTGAPLRVHGAYIDDLEVHRVADDWRARGAPQYIDEITQVSGEFGEAGTEEDTEDTDLLYDEAVQFVLQTRKASTSSVQRRFKIGYNRAARLVDEMERTGVVGPLEGGFRDVLVTSVSDGGVS